MDRHTRKYVDCKENLRNEEMLNETDRNQKSNHWRANVKVEQKLIMWFRNHVKAY